MINSSKNNKNWQNYQYQQNKSYNINNIPIINCMIIKLTIITMITYTKNIKLNYLILLENKINQTQIIPDHYSEQF